MTLEFVTHFDVPWPEPFGVQVVQSWGQIAAHLRIIQLHRVKLFVEIGAFKGGLSSFIGCRKNVDWDFQTLALEKDESLINPMSRTGQVEFRIADAWSSESIQHVKVNVDNCARGAAYIFCDGGDKPKEVHLYKSVLRVGDLIAVHDYPGEITDADLADLDSDPALIQVEPEEYRYGVALPVYKRIK